ncbi:MAG: glycosyl hydrolase 115 family protein [Opitutus sp.]
MHAVSDFVTDAKEATGIDPAISTGVPSSGLGAAIMPMVLGQSVLLDQLEASGRLQFAALRGLSESFRIVALAAPVAGVGHALLVVGSDPNGAMYGMYQLSEHLFGTDPMKFWSDHVPARRDNVTWDGSDLQVGPPAFRYRGLFINDEDSLIGWKGSEPADQVLDEEVYARILETICRLKGNLIAPAMFARYMTPTTRRLAHDRGLFYTASHLEILLTNPQNYWTDFCKRTWGREFPYSYTSHPEKLRTYWADAISRHEGYRNIWPVGLKGITDFAFWFSDPTAPSTMEDRAEVVNSALHDQLALLTAKDANAVATLTMRDEVLTMYNTGRIKLADNLILIWDDDGHRAVMRQLPKSGTQGPAGDGVYYHLAYCDNPRVQWVPLTVMRDEFKRIVDAGATRYALFNVGNIREFVLPIRAAMQMTWDMKPWYQESDRPERFLENWSRFHFGSEAAAEIAKVYSDYNALEYPCRLTSIVEGLISHTTAMELKLRAPAPYDYIWNPVSALDWVNRSGRPELLNWYARTMRFGPFHPRLGAKLSTEYLEKTAPQWEALHARALALTPRVATSGRAFFNANLLMQLETSRQVNRWAVASLHGFALCARRDYVAAATAFTTAAECMETIFAIRQPNCKGKWQNWYRGEYHNVWSTCPWALKPDWHAKDSRALASLARVLAERANFERASAAELRIEVSNTMKGTYTFVLSSDAVTRSKVIRIFLLVTDVERDGKVIVMLNDAKLPDTTLHAKVYHEIVKENPPGGIVEFELDKVLFLEGTNVMRFEMGGGAAGDRYLVEDVLVVPMQL